MKRKLALFLTMILAASCLFAGCGGSEPAAEDNAAETTAELRTGLALDTSVAKSADGTAQSEVTMAAVVVDAEDKIVSCVIDVAQTAITFSEEGKITTDPASAFLTKQELGADYGLKGASKIGKEWNEQADAFAAYCIGKTADEVLGIAVTDKGGAKDADLAASCSIAVSGFQKIVAEAVANAAVAGAQAGDKLGLGVVTDIAKSKDAADGEDGQAQAYTTVSAVTVGADGKITSAAIDAVQANVNFDAAGKITSDVSAEVLSKNELGDDYGLKAASKIGKDWYEQAAAYAAYAAGKTADEVNATEVTEGVPADADLAASVTVKVVDFNAAITKAAANAK